MTAGGHLAQDHAQRELVRSKIDACALGLLWTHVRHSAEEETVGRLGQPRDLRGLRVVTATHLGESEVQNLDAAVRREHHVFGLEIPMDDAGVVRGREPLGNLETDIEEPLQRYTSPSHFVSQRRSVDELRHEIRRVLLDADVVNNEDVGVVQTACRDGFLREAPVALGVAGCRLGKDLDGDLALQPGILRPVHLAHPTRAEWTDDLVRTETRRRTCLHRSRLIA